MKRILNTILVIILLLTVVSVAFHPIPAQAGPVDIVCLFNPSLCTDKGFSIGGVFKGTVALMGELALSASAWFLSVSGMVLNIAIVLTLNIKALYEATPAIDQIWLVIRNLSSMFIIFALIYTSILTILDAAKTSASTLIKNIIMAGILINFSLFFTKTLIDASNLVSLQFYRALVPNSATIDKNSISSILGSATPTAENGLSNIFMQNLKLPSLYNNPKGFLTGASESDFFNIIIATIGGSILILLAAGSILAAAIAFIIRIVILLLLMGFSPVYFVGMIFPQIESNISSKWRSMLIGQLVFMPVYLLLMYVSVRFLTGIDGRGFFSQLDAARDASSKNNFMMATVGLVLQYTIAYFVMLAPLIAALKLGGDSAKWGSTAQKWVSDRLKGGLGFTAQHTIGRGAKSLQENFSSSNIAARNPNMAIIANNAIKNIASKEFLGSKGGYEKRFKDYSKAREDFGKKDLKINDNYKKQFVKYGLDVWDSKTKDIERDMNNAQSDFNNPGISDEDRQKARKKYAELKIELDARNKAEREGRKDKYLEAEALKARKEEYAKNLEKGRDFFTTKARKNAAKSIRDEINKSEDKKLLKALSDLTKGESKDDEKAEEKPDSKK